MQRRYWVLVKAQGHAASAVSAGLASLPSAGTPFAQTQALWRFLHNERVTLPALVEPLREAATAALDDRPGDYALVAHDWCKLDFAGHASKRDQTQITNKHCFGYELTSSLLVDAECGAPLGLLEQQLRCADGVYSTRAPNVQPVVAHLEQVLPTMQASGTWELSKRVVHVIDREADSLAHLREWTDDGHLVLVRVDHTRVVTWKDERCPLPQIVAALHSQQAFRFARTIKYQGANTRQFVAETTIVMKQIGRKRQGRAVPRQRIPGEPLTLRMIVAQVRADDETVLAEWLLFTNVPSDVPAAKIALWYDWRWRIESFFKLLKTAGMHVEQWQQETAPAIARRLLVAAMSCLTVWHLMADDSPAAQTLKPLLIRLSARLMKRNKPVTAPALLAGLHTLLAMLELLEDVDLDELRQLAQAAIPRFFPSS